MSKNIVVLSGSPRKGGSTDKLTAAFVEGASHAGKKVTLFRVADMSIGGCRGCSFCHKKAGFCVQDDDMGGILDLIKEADAVVFASPVYYCSVSAQLKLAIDRLFALSNAKLSVKYAALLLTCGEASTIDGAVSIYQIILPSLHCEDAGTIVASGLYGENVSIDGRDELKQAYELGQKI